MSQTASNPNPASRLKKILLGLSDELKRLPLRRPGDASGSQPADSEYRIRSRLLPAFWTVASFISMFVNVVLIAILLIALRMLGTIQLTADDQFSGMLGGLYHNFVKMDQATISANIPVQQTIPLNINVPVRITKATADVRLIAPTTIQNAHVLITEGGVQIDADATVTLPVNTKLLVEIDSTNPNYLPFILPVQDQIPVTLNVPVNIPMNQTQLHEPFVGLQAVVKPYYCLVEPNATLNGVQICSPLASPVIQPTPTFPIVP